jgi:CheY-like chemotaxis protein
MYAESLRRCGFCTLQASNASDAFRLASELPPSAIVTDVHLEGEEDGLRLTRRLKQDERIKSVPVVILTGYVFARIAKRPPSRLRCLRAETVSADALSRRVTLIERHVD